MGEKFHELRDIARNKVMLADHLLTQTYPLVKDTRLLLAVIENLFLALTNAVGSLLYYERAFKRVPPFTDNFENKYNLFRDACLKKYHLRQEYLILMRELKEIILEHKKSPVEFTRKDRFVICGENYKMRSIGVEELKRYLSESKLFVQEVTSLVNKNDGVFR